MDLEGSSLGPIQLETEKTHEGNLRQNTLHLYLDPNRIPFKEVILGKWLGK
jgi:hypothetical protein